MATEVAMPKDLRGRTGDELKDFIRDKKDELLKLKFQKAIGQLENVRRIAAVKRELSRALTIQAEKAKQEKKS